MASGSHDFIGYLLQFVDTARRNRQFDALGRQNFGNTSANAHASTCDQCCFILKLQIHDAIPLIDNL
jgi:hypothetical protein